MSREVDAAADEHLVRRSAAGDERAFAVLVEKYKGMVYATACRLLKDRARAEDAAQETFIKAYAALPGFEARSKFSSWLYRICYNTCISELRRRRPETGLAAAEAVEVSGPADDFRRKGIREAVEAELSRMPDDYRAALTLYHFNGLSYEEIAELTRKPMGTVKAQIHRARQSLKERLLARVGWDQLREVMWR